MTDRIHRLRVMLFRLLPWVALCGLLIDPRLTWMVCLLSLVVPLVGLWLWAAWSVSRIVNEKVK